uniref:E1B 55 kDa protein n=1 Tax=Bat mastadenovirus TaxID=740971 RepID=A0A894JDM4_9ADEN|nr:E1B 55K [Bat mastadenovirus]
MEPPAVVAANDDHNAAARGGPTRNRGRGVWRRRDGRGGGRGAGRGGQRPPPYRGLDAALDPLHALGPIRYDYLAPPVPQREFRDVVHEERENGPADNVFFESIKAVYVNPGDDLGEAIKNHAKIVLKRGAVYEITSTVLITGACYIIGQCAIVRSRMGREGPMFQVLNSNIIPAIGYMERICFSDMVFDCQDASTAVCCVSERNILFHGCIFSGPHMLCLDMKAGAEVRGCQFMGVVCAVRTKGLYSVRLKNSTFEKCIFGLVASTKATVSHCFFRDCTCAIRLGGAGSITHCQFIVTDSVSSPMNLELCTCQGGGSHATALGNIHVVSHKEASWPKFCNNVLLRAKLYLGRRRGVFHPKYCLMGLSVIAAPRGVAQRVYLFGAYDSNCAIMQLTPTEGASNIRMCTCGESHPTPCMRASYVTDTRINRELNSQDTAEFSSSDEE